jgi:putative resolvase
MKLSAWARKNDITYQTAWNWFKSGRLPVQAIQTATGTILVANSPPAAQSIAIYARVSSSGQREDLDRQIARLSEYAVGEGWRVTMVLAEIGSGLNGARPKLLKALSSPAVSVLVEHRDRLSRFGFEYIEAALSAQGSSDPRHG